MELSAVKRQPFGTSLVVQWLVQGNMGSIPGLGTKIPHASGQLSPCVTTRVCVRTATKNPHQATKIPTQPDQSINILKRHKDNLLSKCHQAGVPSWSDWCPAFSLLPLSAPALLSSLVWPTSSNSKFSSGHGAEQFHSPQAPAVPHPCLLLQSLD